MPTRLDQQHPGVERSTLNMIAERGGNTRVTLYANVGSRDALVERVVERELAEFTESMFAAYDDTTDVAYGARARHSVEATFEYARRNPEGFRILLGHRQEAGRRLPRQSLSGRRRVPSRCSFG